MVRETAENFAEDNNILKRPECAHMLRTAIITQISTWVKQKTPTNPVQHLCARQVEFSLPCAITGHQDLIYICDIGHGHHNIYETAIIYHTLKIEADILR